MDAALGDVGLDSPSEGAADEPDVADAAIDGASDTPPGRCVSRKPPRALISDFSSLDNSAFGVTLRDPVVGEIGGGGSAGVTIDFDFSNADWRISGRSIPRDGNALLGLDWACEDIRDSCPMDASDYAGIQLTVSSITGTLQAVDFFMHTIEDDPPPTTIQCGTCVELADASAAMACLRPRARFAVSGTATVVTLRWADFTGGLPNPSVDPAHITAMYMVPVPPPPADGGFATFDFDLTIDDIRFIPR